VHMVDIRGDRCGILVGGSTAPGINGVISSIVIQCTEWGIVPVGIRCGWKYLKQGLTSPDYHKTLTAPDVTRFHNRGGSILQTSKQQLDNSDDVQNVVRALQHLKLRYFVTIGGTETAFSAHKLAQACSKARMNMFITHVPKTIFNDLPLPDNCYTFGFSTARELGVKIVSNLCTDAETMGRWYIVTVIGARTGHLSLGIGVASAVTLTLIPEQFEHRRPKGFIQYAYKNKYKKTKKKATTHPTNKK